MTASVAVGDLDSLVGVPLGHSDWHTLDERRIRLFADATGDHQWIHVDADRAARSRFGGPIAHGHLTLALAPVVTAEIIEITGVELMINHGVQRVRFPAPVRAGSDVRASGRLLDVRGRPHGLVEAVMRLDFEARMGGRTQRVCTAETVTLLQPLPLGELR